MEKVVDMMRKRGGNGSNPNNSNGSNLNNIKSNGNISSAVSKLLSQNQTSNSSSISYRDGQSIILDVREPMLAGSTTTNGSHHRGSITGGDDISNHSSTTAQLNAKNHRLAKELVRVCVCLINHFDSYSIS
jgi:hypothetical protein